MNGRALPFVPRTPPGVAPSEVDPPVATSPEEASQFATMAELSLLVERIARSLHDAYSHLDGRSPALDPYDALTAEQKALLRDHAIVAIQSLCPWLHAAAASAAARVSANFDRGLDVYVAKLTQPSRIR